MHKQQHEFGQWLYRRKKHYLRKLKDDNDHCYINTIQERKNK